MGDKPQHTPEERQAIVDHVCDEIVTKKRSLFKVLAEDAKLPSYSLFTKWQSQNEEIREQIARAREAALEALIEDMIDISQSDAFDHNEKRVRLIAIEKAAMLLAPRRFNTQRSDITSGGKPLPAPTAQPFERIEAILALFAHRRRIGQARTIELEAEPELDDLMR